MKDGVPHGIGHFTTEIPKTLNGATTQGTWEKGVMQGYAMAENNLVFNYYFNVDGRIHGKFIVHRKCGGFFHRQYHEGKQFGVVKTLKEDGTFMDEAIFTVRRM